MHWWRCASPPLLPGRRTSEVKASPSPEATLHCALRVLVAEDNVVNQKVAHRILTKLGCRVDIVCNGLEAVEAVSQIPYDIVFMDCSMPEMDGFAATQGIRTLQGGSQHTTIIAMTANAMAGEREKCLEAGMDDYLSKPVVQKDLAAMIKRWGSPMTDHDRRPAREQAAPPDQQVVDRSRLDELADLGDEENTQWLRSIVDNFCDDSSSRIVKLVVAAEAGDPRPLESVAHALKGSCSNIGAVTMAAHAESLQTLGRSGSVQGAVEIIGSLEREFERVKAELESYVEFHAQTK